MSAPFYIPRGEGLPAILIDDEARTITVEVPVLDVPVDTLTCRECGISWTSVAVDYRVAWQSSWIEHERIVHERVASPDTQVVADVDFMSDGSRRIMIGRAE